MHLEMRDNPDAGGARIPSAWIFPAPTRSLSRGVASVAAFFEDVEEHAAIATTFQASSSGQQELDESLQASAGCMNLPASGHLNFEFHKVAEPDPPGSARTVEANGNRLVLELALEVHAFLLHGEWNIAQDDRSLEIASIQRLANFNLVFVLGTFGS